MWNAEMWKAEMYIWETCLLFLFLDLRRYLLLNNTLIDFSTQTCYVNMFLLSALKLFISALRYQCGCHGFRVRLLPYNLT